MPSFASGLAARGRVSLLAAPLPSLLVALSISVALGSFALVGCSGSSQVKDPKAEGSLTEAERVLKKMIDIYADANTYSDRGVVRMTGRSGGKPFDEAVPFSTTLERPGKLHMHLYGATYVSDGTTCWAWHDDIAGIMAKRPAPKTAMLTEVYTDEALNMEFHGTFGTSLPSEMLLGADAMDLIRQGGKPELMSDDTLDDRKCYRVRVKRPDGNTTYWIDKQSFVLRRIDLPTERIALTMSSAGAPVSDLKITAEFLQAQLNKPLDNPEAFHVSPPPQLKFTERLDPMWASPAPPPLAETLGKKLDSYVMRTLDGRPFESTQLAGKTCVFFFVDARQIGALKKIDEAYRTLGKDPGIVFNGVNIDVAVGDADLKKELEAEDCKVPVLQLVVDPKTNTAATNVFGVTTVPSLFIVDRQGVVQDYEGGISAKSHADLTKRIQDVAAGRSLVDLAKARHDKNMQEYERATQAHSAILMGLNAPKNIAAKSQPKTLKLTQVWQSQELKRPGNIVVAEETGKPTRVVVLDGTRTVGEFDGAGKLVRTVELDVPKEPVETLIAYLRTALDKDGKRYFVGCGPAQQQFHVFDADFKKLGSFPDGEHAGISDVQVGDLNGDKRPEIVVGYWGDVGVRAMSLDGISLWSDRTLPPDVQHLALTGPDEFGRRLVLCTTGAKQLAIIDEQGKTLTQAPIGERTVRLITAAELGGDGNSELCAIASISQDEDVAVGFLGRGREQWSYPLPKGFQPVPHMQSEMVVGGKVLPDGTGLWIFAAADGTIHFVDKEGKPVDSFAWGSPIHGLALGLVDELPTLLVSDEKTVTAVRLTR